MNECMNFQKECFCDSGSKREMKSVAIFSVDCFNTLTLIVPRFRVLKGIQHKEITNY